MRGPPGLIGDEVEIQRLRARIPGDLVGSIGRDDAKTSLRGSERDQDVQPTLQPCSLLEQLCQLRGTPQMRVLL